MPRVILACCLGIGFCVLFDGSAMGFVSFSRFPVDQDTGPFSDSDAEFLPGLERVGQVVANNFSFPTDTAIDYVTWYGNNSSGNSFNFERPFVVQVFTDDGGLPSQTPLVDLHLTIGYSSTLPVDLSRAYRFEADLPHTRLTGGVQYWLSIYEDDPSTTGWAWFFGPITPVLDYGLAFRNRLPDDNWRLGNGAPTAFILRGVEVPEPAAYLLMATALIIPLPRRGTFLRR